MAYHSCPRRWFLEAFKGRTLQGAALEAFKGAYGRLEKVYVISRVNAVMAPKAKHFRLPPSYWRSLAQAWSFKISLQG